MDDRTTGDSTEPSSDTGYEALLARHVDSLLGGGKVDPEQIFLDHPEHATRLLQDLQSFVDPDAEPRPGPLGTLGDYTLRRQIGRGGMGVVYEAWQNSLDRQVALKVLPPGVAADAKSSTRFLREAQIAAKLSHPQIVPVFATGIEGGTPWYAMEFVEGETLAQVLARIKEAKPDEDTPLGKKDQVGYFAALANAFADVADGLQHAHSKGVIHRDIKPSNLILDGEGRLRILDFGLARLEGQESLTASGDFLGTPLYMSPEQARREKIPVDHRTDVYSLGATLYEMLTLQPPFRGKDHADTLSQIIERDPVEPRKVNPRAPKDLETIALKCLRKEAGDRYGTAEAIGQDLRRFVRGEVIEARPQTTWERLVRKTWSRRRAISTGLVLVLAGAVLAGQLLGMRHERQRQLEEEYDSLVRQGELRLELVPALRKPERREGSGTWAGWLDASNTDHVSLGALGSATRALEDLQKASAIFPERADAQYHGARALLFLGRGQEARDALARLGRRERPFVPALMLESRLLELRVDREGAAGALKAALDAADEPWEKAWIEANQAWRTKDYPHAVVACDQVLAACDSGEPFPGLALVARMGRGSAWMALKSYARALQDYSVAAYLAPRAVEPVILAAQAMYFLGEKEEAEKLLLEVFGTTPWRDEAALAISALYDRLGDEAKHGEWAERIQNPSIHESKKAWREFFSCRYQEAKRAARKAIELDRTNVEAYQALQFAYFMTGPQEMGVRVLEEGLRHRERSWTLVHYLGWALSLAGRQREAIARFEEAARLAVNPGDDYSRMAEAYMNMGQYALGDEWALRAKEADPDNPLLALHRGNALYRFGRLDEALEIFSAVRDEGYLEEHYGEALFLKGRWDEALEVLHRGQKQSVNVPLEFLCAALIQERRGRPTEAVEELVRLFEKSPTEQGAHEFMAELLRAKGAQVALETVDRLAKTLEKARDREARNPELLNTLALALALLPGEEAHRRAIQAALDGLSALEDPRSPSRGSEEGLRSTLRTLLSTSAPQANGEPSPSLHPVLAGKWAQPDSPIFRARSLRAQGAPVEAEKVLRSAIESTSGLGGDRHIWEQWLDVSFRDLRLRPAEVLQRFPDVPAPETSPPEDDFSAMLDHADTHTDPVDHAEDARWFLTELAAGRSLRIRCGGDALELINGEVWGKDRFFIGGRKPSVLVSGLEIQGTDRDALYWRRRHFHGGHPAAGGYSIPVPPGSWRVHLHFAETERNWPGQRRFDVYVQGKVVLKDFDILAHAPFNGALEHVFDTAIEEGPLDIRFSTGIQLLGATISAIEVEGLE